MMEQSVEGIFPEIKILVMTDIHYDRDNNCSLLKRETTLGLELIKRVRLATRNEKIDLIILLGDIINNGNSTRSSEYLNEIKEELDRFKTKYIVLPGNHDGDTDRIKNIFGKYEGLHNINDYQIIAFSDKYNEKDQCKRDIDRMITTFKKVNINKPTFVFQHNPIYPQLGEIGGYPYDMINSEEVSAVYAKNNVLLSLSGHYHDGIQVCKKDGVEYITCAALCEAPYTYSMLTLRGVEYKMQEFCLNTVETEIDDMHIHTHFAYCSNNDMTPDNSIKRKDLFGLRKIGLVEHATQLYIPEKDYWGGRFVDEPQIIDEYKNTEFNRMKQYKTFIKKFKSDKIKIGLEAELNKDGNFAMLMEDYVDWDFIIGAVHYLPKKYTNNTKMGFMWANHRLTELNVDILAHPFRYFRRNKENVPKELYKELANLLAATNTAVELNFHINEPDIEFFKECVNQGVKIALGSDSHELYEVGCSKLYFDFLEKICGKENISSIIY